MGKRSTLPGGLPAIGTAAAPPSALADVTVAVIGTGDMASAHACVPPRPRDDGA